MAEVDRCQVCGQSAAAPIHMAGAADGGHVFKPEQTQDELELDQPVPYRLTQKGLDELRRMQ